MLKDVFLGQGLFHRDTYTSGKPESNVRWLHTEQRTIRSRKNAHIIEGFSAFEIHFIMKSKQNKKDRLSNVYSYIAKVEPKSSHAKTQEL